MITPKEQYAPELWEQLNQQDPDNYPLTVDDWRTIRTITVKTGFQAEFTSRIFTCSLGFPVDNRRSGSEFDRDNVQSLIDLGIDPIDFKDADGTVHSLTLAQLQTIKQEMIQDGLGLYQKKWSLEAQIGAATTIDELKAITW